MVEIAFFISYIKNITILSLDKGLYIGYGSI